MYSLPIWWMAGYVFRTSKTNITHSCFRNVCVVDRFFGISRGQRGAYHSNKARMQTQTADLRRLFISDQHPFFRTRFSKLSKLPELNSTPQHKDQISTLLDFIVVNENMQNLVLAAMYFVGMRAKDVRWKDLLSCLGPLVILGHSFVMMQGYTCEVMRSDASAKWWGGGGLFWRLSVKPMSFLVNHMSLMDRKVPMYRQCIAEYEECMFWSVNVLLGLAPSKKMPNSQNSDCRRKSQNSDCRLSNGKLGPYKIHIAGHWGS